MSQSYFNQNQNLQIHGDVNFISSSEPTHDGHSMFLGPAFANIYWKIIKTFSTLANKSGQQICNLK